MKARSSVRSALGADAAARTKEHTGQPLVSPRHAGGHTLRAPRLPKPGMAQVGRGRQGEEPKEACQTLFQEQGTVMETLSRWNVT